MPQLPMSKYPPMPFAYSKSYINAFVADHKMNHYRDLKAEYLDLFHTCVVDPKHQEEVSDFATRLLAGESKYEEVELISSVPWYVIGLIHGMECDFSFKEHLHNGDPLTARTVHEPKDRPSIGDPPFEWSVSAVDALHYDGFTTWTDWTIPGICFKLEGYNGWGYRNHKIHSPYLWSYSNHYERGKFIADGVWSADAVSKQVGSITALKSMIDKNQVALIGGVS